MDDVHFENLLDDLPENFDFSAIEKICNPSSEFKNPDDIVLNIHINSVDDDPPKIININQTTSRCAYKAVRILKQLKLIEEYHSNYKTMYRKLK